MSAVNVYKPVLQSLESIFFKLKKQGVNSFGYREFHQDGSSSGFCTHDKWLEISNEDNFYKSMANYYKDELLKVTSNKLRYITRYGANTENSNYLDIMYKNKVWNTLVIYRKAENIIRGYYYISSSESRDMLDNFFNNLKLFENYSDSIQEKISDKLCVQNIDEISSTKLFSVQTAKLIFEEFNKNKANTSLSKFQIPFEFEGKSYSLTNKEIEIIQMFSLGFSYKEIAKQLNKSCRTVEKQMQVLKQKFNLNLKSKIFSFAKKISSINLRGENSK